MGKAYQGEGADSTDVKARGWLGLKYVCAGNGKGSGEGTITNAFSCVQYYDLSCGDEELLPGFNQEMDATISPALARDHEDCCGFVLIPTEPWSTRLNTCVIQW